VVGNFGPDAVNWQRCPRYFSTTYGRSGRMYSTIRFGADPARSRPDHNKTGVVKVVQNNREDDGANISLTVREKSTL